MRRFNSPIRLLMAALIAFQCCIAPTAQSGEILGRIKRLISETKYKGTKPELGHDCAMECLAENIDWLEHHIDTYGSVVTKQPDIWGEARLTKHRDEYERMMFGELGKFEDTINASITQKDNAFLAQAIALSTAASGTGVGTAAPGSTSVSVDKATATLVDVDKDPIALNQFGIDTNPAKPGISIEPVLHLDQMSRYLKHLHELRRINEGDDTSDSPGYSLNLVRIPVSITPGKLTRQGFGAEVTVTAEPVISDDLMPTTFQNLASNDVVDFLGLPLVRVTEQLTAFEAIISKEVFRDAVVQINQVFEQYNNRLLSDSDRDEQLTKQVAKVLQDELLTEALAATYDKQVQASIAKLPTETQTKLASSNEFTSMAASTREPVKRAVANSFSSGPVQYQAFSLETIGTTDLPPPVDVKEQVEDIQKLQDLVAAIQQRDVSKTVVALVAFEPNASKALNAKASEALDQLSLRADAAASPAPSGRTRRALNPINPSSLVPIMGTKNLIRIAKFFESSYYGRYIRWRGGRNSDDNCNESRVNLLDARRYLRAEVQAAYELLSEPAHLELFAKLANPESGLSAQIHSGHLAVDRPSHQPSVADYRHYFFDHLHMHMDVMQGLLLSESQTTVPCLPDGESIRAEIDQHDSESEAETPVEALAWAVLVECALLNDRLNRDVRKLAKAKEVYSLNIDRDHWYFLPDVVDVPATGNEWLRTEFQAANEVFKEYVRARWPIHVFAVDPVAQDQNVADVSQRKRELQFALALGFATGQIGVNSLTQFSRSLETQIETIALNRTIVGFGHGDDTFGWRFYPRVQGLDAPGTLGTIRETLLGTSRDYDLRHRQLEPGQRECVAIVLMPSFVPYADFDIRTDWFKLTNPKNTALTMKESLELSRAVTAMRNSRAQCANYQHLYREGELRRLLKRVDQLDRELPLQTTRSLVPYENTLGGFEMFNTGVTDLSPELIGWYGAPGIRTSGDDCGCTRGCLPATETTCNSTATCKALNESLQALNATLAASPVPACEGKGTTLFLVGDNFSVHDTKVIAGGTCIPHVRLISRELMQVTIPSCVNTVELCESDVNNAEGVKRSYVAIYVATPYGITNHLHVPIMEAENEPCCSPSGVTENDTSVLDRSAVSLPSAAGNPSGEPALVFASATLANDRTVWAPIRLSSLIQESENSEASTQIGALSDQISDLKAKLDAVALSPDRTQIDVNVPSLPVFSEPRHHESHSGKFPMLGRIKTAVGEQLRNCRDNLPIP